MLNTLQNWVNNMRLYLTWIFKSLRDFLIKRMHLVISEDRDP